jgi:hypothetical protein
MKISGRVESGSNFAVCVQSDVLRPGCELMKVL